MAVEVSRDLTVQILQDVNAAKLTDRQQAVRATVKRGEPKCLGVSQVMLGLMVMSYSIPLHFTEVTEVIHLGVPWWSGLTFIAAGVVAIILDKHSTMKSVCLLASLVSTVLSVVAVIIYSVDIDRNPEVLCVKTQYDSCNEEHYATRLSRGIKSALLVFTLAQTAISAVLGFLLFRHRRGFGQYASLTQAAPTTSTSLNSSDLN
ncbi:transmembrane protein 176 isoform X2 [Sander vitreus]